MFRCCSRRHINLAPALLATLFAVTAARPARAIIVMGGRDATGIFTNSGTNYNPAPFDLGSYEGRWGGFLGTPVAPQYFLTATHVGGPSNGQFYYNDGGAVEKTYHATFVARQNDLAIWKIADGEAFTHYAPLYYGGNEIGQSLVMIGNGLTRGNAVTKNGNLVGWEWGGIHANRSWGTNAVSEIFDGEAIGAGADFGGDLLHFTFDRQTDAGGNVTNPDEGIFTAGDSSGAIFVRDPHDGVYKLAGLNSLVDTVTQGPTTNPNEYYTAALFDARGFYSLTDQVTGNSPVPLGSYSTRISSRIGFISSFTGLPAAVPEPGLIASFALAGAGGFGFLTRCRRARTSQSE